MTPVSADAPMIDIDPCETSEWCEAIRDVALHLGVDRVKFLLQRVLNDAQRLGMVLPVGIKTPYANTLNPGEVVLPDMAKLCKLSGYVRWNAAAMVVQAGKKAPELGGHLATYASIADVYDVGYDYFFKGYTQKGYGDLVYFQGHAAPGNYARAFVEGRLEEKDLAAFRRDADGQGLSSYPHPWSLPDFWQFPTVSMGLGAMQAAYDARIMRYLEHRGLLAQTERTVWAFCGDGEMDEPESIAALSMAARTGLDNLVFVVNANLQSLDGPVRGGRQIVQDLEAIFHGHGWRVIKVVTNSHWDRLFAQDKQGVLLAAFNQMLDGQAQLLHSRGPAYLREHFFNSSPQLQALIADWSDEDLAQLGGGGHDPHKIYEAFAAAVAHKGQPVVILTRTVKGYGLGEGVAGANTTHNQKKLDGPALIAYARRLGLPLSDEQAEQAVFCRPEAGTPERRYLDQRRAELGGVIPQRVVNEEAFETPELSVFQSLLDDSGEREFSTTMAFGRVIGILLRDKSIGPRVVPIMADEARTFGMEGLFRQIGIYMPGGQKFTPADHGQVMYYREAQDGQLLQEGLSEANGISSWIAAASSYSSHGVALLPFFIYYSMFGFQRVGDFIWAAGDRRCRGFLIGAVAGRTTLAGEGLQHDDGHSHLFSSVYPNCISYDPCFAYELAVIIRHGIWRMFTRHEDVFFYLTVMNENYAHPAMPPGVEQDILRGMYRFSHSTQQGPRVQLLGSGAILREVIAAGAILQATWKIAVDIWSVTSYSELRREGLAVERHNWKHPAKEMKETYVAQCLQACPKAPIIAASDYVRLVPDQIRPFIDQPFYVLGTDGFGRSDTRETLRAHFEVDSKAIVYTALLALYRQGQIDGQVMEAASKQYGPAQDKVDPASF